MQAVFARLRSMWRDLRRRSSHDTDMQDEMRFHIEMEAERLTRRHGLDPDEARRRAHVAFGGIEKYKQEGRDTNTWQWIETLHLDARLGLRMLAKYRGLTMVGGLAMAVAIAICATFFEVTSQILNPALPIEDGERVVALQNIAADNFAAWSAELQSIEQVSAFRTVQHNLGSGNAPPEPLRIAEMTATGFALSRTPPLLGRYVLPDDALEGAPPVIVIGHQVWLSRFGGDPQIVGRTLMIDGVSHTVIGVMPEGFRFPHSHQFWAPLHGDPLNLAQSDGPEVSFFGRLAPGVTLEAAQAELVSVGQRVAASLTEAQERSTPRVVLYTLAHADLSQPFLVWLLRAVRLLVGALTVVVAVNLAILIYARTVTRLGELAVRTALGASRRRILGQLFIEAFALAAVGAGIGLVFTHFALRQIQELTRANGTVPFWLHFGLTLETAIYAFALAAAAALIMGVVPGLKALARNLHANLHELSGRSGTRLGPIWTTLVIAQVAVAVAILPAAAFVAWQVVSMDLVGAGFPAEKIVVGFVALGDEGPAVDPARVRQRQQELSARLATEPNVSAITFSSFIPGFAGSKEFEFEDGMSVERAGSLNVASLDVAVDLFDTYGVEIVAGRALVAADTGAAAAVVVNRAFANLFLNGRSPLGLRFRYVDEGSERGSAPDSPWYQVVGVVRDFPAFNPALTGSTVPAPAVFHPAVAGTVHPLFLSVRFQGEVPEGFPGRFREIAAGVDPTIQLRRVTLLSDFYGQLRSFWRYVTWAVGLITLSVLLLSAAGIYALMSFTVAQRTREIGIRTALGAHPRRILLNVFGRVTMQLVVGVLLGSLLAGGVFSSLGLSLDRTTAILLGVAGVMSMVAVLAAWGPARRGLRIQASEALRC